MHPLNDTQFEKYSKMIYEKFGIHIRKDKKEMLEARLRKLINKHNLESYDDYFYFLMTGARKEDWDTFANEITINKTNFFREKNHFDYIRDKIDSILASNTRIAKNREMRIWSSACSTGEEAYTLGMVLSECLPQDISIKILATDVSTKVLKTAASGIYPASAVRQDVEPHYIIKYFDSQNDNLKVKSTLKEKITFRIFNLMNSFPFSNTFDIIFCRNVMIYFDFKTQTELIQKFYNVLSPGGLLFIGHSESLLDNRHHFQYVQPTIYRK